MIICAILRQLHLTLSLALSILLHHIFPRSPSSYLVQNGWIMQPFDVIVVDQLSASIPLLRWLLATRVLFYCHFPDLLLSPGANLSAIPGSSSATRTSPSTLSSILRLLYRIPFNAIEHSTTGKYIKIFFYVLYYVSLILYGQAKRTRLLSTPFSLEASSTKRFQN